MRSSPWSLGLLMMVMGAALVFFGRQPGHPPPLTATATAVPLLLAGALVFVRRSLGYRVGVAAGLLTIAMSIASFVVHRELVPTPPVALCVGLVITLRVLLAWSFERRAAERAAFRRDTEESFDPPGDPRP